MMEAHTFVPIDTWGKFRASTVPLDTENDGTTALPVYLRPRRGTSNKMTISRGLSSDCKSPSVTERENIKNHYEMPHCEKKHRHLIDPKNCIQAYKQYFDLLCYIPEKFQMIIYLFIFDNILSLNV